MAYNERWSSCACSHACVLLWEISASYAWWESKNWGLREGTCIKLAQTCIYYTTLLFCFLFLQHLLGSFLQSSQLADQLATQLVSGYILLYTPAPFREVMWRSYSVPFCSGQFVIYTMWMWDPRFWGPRVSIYTDLGTPSINLHTHGNTYLHTLWYIWWLQHSSGVATPWRIVTWACAHTNSLVPWVKILLLLLACAITFMWMWSEHTNKTDRMVFVAKNHLRIKQSQSA